jgi:hypothetical protein
MRVFPCRWPGWLGFTAMGMLGLAMLHHPMLVSRLRRVQTDGDDPRLINYLLEHSFRWITQQPGHERFWDVPMFYPTRNVTAYSDTLLCAGPPYWAFRALAFLPDTAFQLWMLTVSVLNYVSGYWLFRSGFKRSVRGACCAAFLFAYGAPRGNELAHPQLLPQVFSAIALWAICKVFVAAPCSLGRSFLLWSTAALAVAAQLYVAFYMGWFLMFSLVMAACWALVDGGVRGRFLTVLGRSWPALLGAIALAELAIYPLFAHYLQAASLLGMRRVVEVATSIPYMRTWFYMGHQNWVWGFSTRWPVFGTIGYNLEQAQRVGIGFITSVVCLLGINRAWRDPAVRLAALTLVGVAVAVTHFERETWDGFTVGLLVVCFLELQGRDVPASRRRVLSVAFVCMAVTCFPLDSLAIAMLLGVLLYVAGKVVAPELRGLIRRLVPVGLFAFLSLTAFFDQIHTLVLAAGLAVLLEARRLVSGRRIGLWTLVGAAVVLVSGCWLFPSDVVFWRLISALVPGGGALRVISRALLLALVPAGLGMACFFERPWRTRTGALAAGAVFLACVLEQGVTTTSYDKHQTRVAAAALARRIERDCVSFYYGPDRPVEAQNKHHIDAMWAGLEKAVPTVNGYSGARPPGWLPIYEAQQSNMLLDVERLPAVLASWAAQNHMRPGTICWIRDKDMVRLPADTGRAEPGSMPAGQVQGADGGQASEVKE